MIECVREALQPSRRSDSICAPQQQSQVHSGNVDQQPFENVVVFPQVRSSHSASLITVGEAPLDQLTAFPQKSLAFGPLQSLPVGIDDFPLLFFSHPMPFPCLRSEEHTSQLQSHSFISYAVF